MANNLSAYRTEIIDYLKNSNIILDNDKMFQDFKINLGVMLNVLTKEKKFDKPVNIMANGGGEIMETSEDSTVNMFLARPNCFNEKTYEDFEHVELIEKYFQQELGVKIRLLTGTYNKVPTTILELDNVYQKVYMVLLSLIPKLFPTLFTKEDIVANKQLLQSFIDLDSFSESSEKLSELSNIDFEEIEKQHIINSFSEAMVDMNRQRKEDQKRKLHDYRRRMDQAMQSYMDYLRDYNNINANLNASDGVEVDKKAESRALIENLSSLRGFKFVSTSGNVVKYDIVAPLAYIDTEIYKHNSETSHKSCFSGINEKYREDMKKLLDELFLTRDRYEVIVSARFNLRFDGIGSIDVDGDAYGDVSSEYENVMPSPHAMKYRCYGDFANTWQQALECGDYFAAIQQSYAYTQNLNWTDTTVCGYFVAEILNHTYIHDKKDDKYYSAKQIFAQWNNTEADDEEEDDYDEY